MSLATDQEGLLLRQIIMAKGYSRPVIDSYNNFIRYRLPAVLSEYRITTMKGQIAIFSNPVLTKPTIHDMKSNGKPRPLFPSEARTRKYNYMSQLTAQLDMYQISEGKLKPIPGQSVEVVLGKIPVMIHSDLDHLSTFSPEERYRLKREQKNDPGGYFIIKGLERVLLNIEKLRTHSPFLYEDKGVQTVRYTSRTMTDSTVVIISEDQQHVNATFTKIGLKNTINVFFLFYVLGLTSNTVERVYEIMETFIVDKDPQRQARRRKEMREYMYQTANSYMTLTGGGSNLKKITDILVQKFRDSNILTSNRRDDLIFSIVRTELFKNVPMDSSNRESVNQASWTKIRMLSSMCAKYVDFRNGYRNLDDRDSWGIKKVDDAGEIMYLRFVSILKSIILALQNKVTSNNVSTASQIRGLLNSSTLGEQFVSSFSKETWGATRGFREVHTVDILKRDNILSAYAHIRRINTPINKRARIRDKRLIHNTQWNVVCPVNTPEGETCGLSKDSALTTYISLDRDENPVRAVLKGKYEIKPKEDKINSVYLNGVHLGYCNAEKLREELIQTRRNQRTQKLYFDTGIILDSYQELWVYTNGGRPCFPLLIVDKASQELLIDVKGLRGKPLSVLMESGVLEYIDVAENIEERIYVAETIRHLADKRNRLNAVTDRYTKLVANSSDQQEELAAATVAYQNITQELRYTHCLIDPTSILGISASIIPLPEYSQGPRNTYQASMGKQAMGPNSLRTEYRYDTTTKTIQNAGVPIFSTDAHETLGMDEYGGGAMLILAITTYGGQNQEDSLIFNKAALELGLFTTVIHHSVNIKISYNKNGEKLKVPSYSESQAYRYAKLDPKTAIVRLGEYVYPNECLVGKVIIDSLGKERNDSLYLERGKEGVVEAIFETENVEGCKMICIRLRETRAVETGNKYASRYAQKATIGEIKEQVDMPYIVSSNPALNGVVPTAIFNPHGIPSRMTVGKLIEMLVGKVATLNGQRVNATAFRRFTVDTFQDELFKLGFSRSGKERMINGMTGKLMEADIFVGPVYYQALRHLVKDKMQSRATGIVQALTRQPIAGIRKIGGLRLGEMERDALIEHAGTNLLQERFLFSSDVHQTIVCSNCGILAISNIDRVEFRCLKCKDGKYVRIKIPYVFKLLMHLLSAVGINVKLHTAHT